MAIKEFNIYGPCIPALHYMVDIRPKVDRIIKDYIEKGRYFTVNRARQYGKTTTISLLAKMLAEKYVVISLSFEGKEDFFQSLPAFADGLQWSFIDALEKNYPGLSGIFNESISTNLPLADLRRKIKRLCSQSERPVVLIIDEADKASNYQVFMSFLGTLRDMYIQRDVSGEHTFQSVILAGVYDIKNIKEKMRPDAEHRLNSPWNISADFKMNMSFSASEIATMLFQYEADHHTGMKIGEVAERIHYYTNGYPFLVSDLCKIMDETALSWSPSGVDKAEAVLIKENNLLFDDMIKNLTNQASFGRLVEDILFHNADIAFDRHNPDIDLGVMFGILGDRGGKVCVSNIVFESVIYNYYVSIAQERQKVGSYVSDNREIYVKNGHLDMCAVLERFSRFMASEYRDQDSGFLERHARLLFLCYLKPIINGTGNYAVEPETRGNRRMDLVVFYGQEKFIIELKIWRGELYEQKGLQQLADYLAANEQQHGYLLSFCDNLRSPRPGGDLRIGNYDITEVVVAYRDKE